MSEYDCAVMAPVFGTQQSPIDISREQSFVADLPDIGFEYPDLICGSFTQNPWDREHPVFTVSTKAFIDFDVTRAQLKQIHFHSPSEHLIDSVPRLAEFHFVHEVVRPFKGEKGFEKREPSTKIVISVFVDKLRVKDAKSDNEKIRAEQYKAFVEAFSAMRLKTPGKDPSKGVEVPCELIKELQASAGEYFFYRGSLTSGACAEVVTWLVLPNALDIDASLPDALKNAEQDTRDVQPLNRRVVMHRQTLPMKP